MKRLALIALLLAALAGVITHAVMSGATTSVNIWACVRADGVVRTPWRVSDLQPTVKCPALSDQWAYWQGQR